MMMTDRNNKSQNDLAGLFASAKQGAHDLPPGLMDRVLADARRVQDEIVVVPIATPSLLRRLLDVLGGWPEMGGLIAACATGIWLGFAPPTMIPDPLDLVGLTQSDLDMFDADNLIVAWNLE